MNWKDLRGHTDSRDRLRKIIAGGRLAHTWLFAGPDGIGKRTFALLVAQSLFCERHAEAELDCCGVCPSCRQIQAGTHPDLFVITRPEGKRELPIELFLGPPDKRGRAGLCHDLSQTPMAGQRKVAIIDEADLINEAGANALLKTLEEPPEHSLLILISAHPGGLLPTILSRCQLLRFTPPTVAEIVDVLVAREEGTAADIEQAAILSGGSLRETQRLLDPRIRGLRDILYRELSAQPFNSLSLSRGLTDAWDEISTESPVQRELFALNLKFLQRFWQQILWRWAGTPDANEIPEVLSFVERLNFDDPRVSDVLSSLIERVVQAEMELDQNVSLSLAMDALCDDLGKLIRKLPRRDAKVAR